MSTSHVEEIIAVLWSIFCVLLILAKAPLWLVWLVGIKAAGDHAFAVKAAIREIRDP